jgi:succinoglycan biosynthesis protein ExoL
VKLIFVVDTLSQPRIIKRINELIGHDDITTVVYGFKRNKYIDNIKNYKCDIIYFGDLNDSKGIWRKFISYFILFKLIKKEHSGDYFKIYIFGFYPAIINLIFFKFNFFYEISDIVYGYKKFKRIEWLFKWLDLKIIKSSSKTVVTSRGFIDYFLTKENNDLISNKFILKPNKVDIALKEIPILKREKFNISNLVFSYVGAFRYLKTVFLFAEIIGKHFPNHRFYFFGESKFTVEANKLADKYSNVVNFGPFMNPQDLSQIYDKIDIVVATYENQNLNERIAEPNKFYETLFFEKIIVVSPETLLESKINETGCGFICNSYSEKSIINFIQSLSEIKINTVLNNIRKLNKSDLIEQDSNIFFKKLFFNEMRN